VGLSHQLKALSYLVKPAPYPIEKPVVIQFPVIDICNSQCQMCRIWENKKSDDITPEDLRRGLRNPLYSEVASVGLNGGEPTLRKDLAALAAVLFEECPKLRSISLITNAYKFEEVIERIGEVGEVVRRHGGNFDVMVSLDGYGEMHDLVRGKPGNFERARKVLDFVQGSPLVSNVRVGCTIIKANVYGLADLFEFCLSRGVYIKYRLGIPHQRLYTHDLVDPYSLSPEDKYHIAEFLEGLIAHYEKGEHQKFFYRSLIDQLVRGAPRKAGCDWQHRGATITARGELLYCAVQSKSLGRIQEVDSERAFFDNADHLRDIRENKCASCHHDYVGIPSKRQYVRQLVAERLQRPGPARSLLGLYRAPAVVSLRQKRRFQARLARMEAEIGRAPSSAAPREPGSRRVLICGWYGTETLGDKGILGGVMGALRRALGPVEFTLASLVPYVSEMTRRQMPELKGTRIVDTEEGIRLAPAMDLVVFGGGPLMAIDELADMESMFAAARRNGVPTLAAGCGVGPLGAAWHDESLARLLSLASVRIFRDAKSAALARELGAGAEGDVVAEDPAFTWLRDQRDRLPQRPDGDRKVLLLGLREFPYATYARHLSEAECRA
jgi:MoaA/NifB/PqqE/SkfB family radical SAM enzyme